MAHPFDTLAAEKYVNLTTFRKNGQRKTTPVWLGVAGQKAYVWSQRDTWKVKRLRANGDSELTPCNATGSRNTGATVLTTGRLLAHGEAAAAHDALKKKYGLLYRFGVLLGRMRPRSDHVYLEFVPRDP